MCITAVQGHEVKSRDEEVQCSSHDMRGEETTVQKKKWQTITRVSRAQSKANKWCDYRISVPSQVGCVVPVNQDFGYLKALPPHSTSTQSSRLRTTYERLVNRICRKGLSQPEPLARKRLVAQKNLCKSTQVNQRGDSDHKGLTDIGATAAVATLTRHLQPVG